MASQRHEIEVSVSELETHLKDAHTPKGWDAAKNWFNVKFADNHQARMKFLAQFMYSDPLLTKHNTNVDFTVLQGDVIKTTMANVPDPLFPFDERENYYYIVIPPSCSIQPGRNKFVPLARLMPVIGTDRAQVSSMLSALQFSAKKFFYLPPLDEQPDDCIGNLAMFEEISYIANNFLQLANRIASLTEGGWHYYCAYLVLFYSKPSNDEFEIRRGTSPKTVKIENV